VPPDRGRLVIGDHLLRQPDPAQPSRQVGMGTAGSDKACRIACTSFLSRVRWRGQPGCAAVVAVRCRRRATRSRAGNSPPAATRAPHAPHMRRQHAHHRHCIAGRCDDDLVFLAQAAAETSGPLRVMLTRPVGRSFRFPEHHLREGWVECPSRSHRASLAPHWLRLGAARQLRIRALGATGQVAGAASY
jgi:hypothetical protein